jgi:PAS domain S-box-containing protein
MGTVPGELTFRTLHERKDGSRFRSEVRSRLLNRDGRRLMISVVRDISSLVGIEEAFRTSQRQYESLLQNLPGVVHRCLLDDPSVTLYVDDRIENLTGVPAREFLHGGRVLDEFISEGDRAVVASAWQSSAENGGSYDITIVFHLPDGDRRTVREVGHVVAPDGDVHATIERIYFDVTERAERERVLREAFDAEHRRFEQVVAASHQVVYEGDVLSDTMLFIGPLREVFGYGQDAIGTSGAGWRERIHPDDRERVLRERRRKRRSGELVEFEYRWRHANGTYRWVWDRCVFDFGPDGRPNKVLGVMQDISPRKELEAQISSAQRMETVGALAAGLAHDVNNFLTTILGNVDFALMRLESQGAGAYPELEDARRAAIGCAGLVQKLLAFARPAPGGHQLTTVDEILDDTLRILQRLAGPDVSVVTVVSPECPPFAADNVQMQQLLMNLVANSRDAMNGKGQIVIRAEPIPADDLSPAGYVALSVSDSGHGIPPKLRSRIFEPYFTTRPFGGGTGLGLSIVHGIVSAHNGRIDVDSMEGHGATFTVVLPAQSEEPATDD